MTPSITPAMIPATLDSLDEEDAGPGDAAHRGALEFKVKAIQRLVAAAAAEVDRVGGPRSRHLGQEWGRVDTDRQVKASVTVAGDVVTAAVSLTVLWPEPIFEVADQVRARVRDRVAELTGLRVSYVDVHITALPAGRRARRHVE